MPGVPAQCHPGAAGKTHDLLPIDPKIPARRKRIVWGQDCFAELILESSHIAARHSLPFYLTEYNNGLGGTNRDDASGAAFLFRNVGLLESLDMWSWWTVSACRFVWRPRLF